MWIAFIIIATVLFVAIAGVLSGGIFTVILVPLAALGLITAVAVWWLARATGVTEAATDSELVDPRTTPLRRGDTPESSAPSTPERLADSRRAAQ